MSDYNESTDNLDDSNRKNTDQQNISNNLNHSQTEIQLNSTTLKDNIEEADCNNQYDSDADSKDMKNNANHSNPKKLNNDSDFNIFVLCEYSWLSHYPLKNCYVLMPSFDTWEVWFLLQAGTFKDHPICALIKYPKNYPVEPPQVFLEYVIHEDVEYDNDWRIDISCLLQKEWDSETLSTLHLLSAIKNFLLAINVNFDTLSEAQKEHFEENFNKLEDRINSFKSYYNQNLIKVLDSYVDLIELDDNRNENKNFKNYASVHSSILDRLDNIFNDVISVLNTQ